MPLLFGVLVCRLGGSLQLVVNLVEQIFRLLSMTLHVPFVSLLSRKNLLKSSPAQPLSGCKIWMSGA